MYGCMYDVICVHMFIYGACAVHDEYRWSVWSVYMGSMCSVYLVHVYGHGKSQSSFPGGAGANHDKLKEMLICMCDGFMAIDHYPQERCACCAWEMQTEGIPGLRVVPHVARGGGVSEGPSQLRQHVPFTNFPCSSSPTP